jgi:hypothetical protein
MPSPGPPGGSPPKQPPDKPSLPLPPFCNRHKNKRLDPIEGLKGDGSGYYSQCKACRDSSKSAKRHKVGEIGSSAPVAPSMDTTQACGTSSMFGASPATPTRTPRAAGFLDRIMAPTAASNARTPSSPLSSAPNTLELATLSTLGKRAGSPLKNPVPPTAPTPGFTVGGIFLRGKTSQDTALQAAARAIINRLQRDHRVIRRDPDGRPPRTPEPEVVLEALRAGIFEEAIIEAAGSEEADLDSNPFIPFDPSPDPLLLRRPSFASFNSNRAILPRGGVGPGTPSQPLYFQCDNCSWN